MVRDDIRERRRPGVRRKLEESGCKIALGRRRRSEEKAWRRRSEEKAWRRRRSEAKAGRRSVRKEQP